MNKSLWIGIGVFVALAIGAALFLAKPKVETTNKSATPTPTSTATQSSPATEGEVRQVQVTGSEYSFNPSAISLTKGDRVVLTFRNTGKFPHNLTIGELGVATKTVASGQSDTVEFTADKAGTFSFYCSIDGHRGFGMEGSLEVK